MKTVILFREGLSGHYIKALFDDTPNEIQFRVDPWVPNIYHHNNRKFAHDSDAVQCMHRTEIDLRLLQNHFDQVLSVQVYQKIYHGIYNNFYKKLLVENTQLKKNFQNWHANSVNWYDIAYYNLKEYYSLFRQDAKQDIRSDIINFDYILDIDYVEQLFEKYLNKPINNNTRRIVEQYRSLQLQYDLSGSEVSMKDLISILPDKVFDESPWFAAYCIFKFEVNNNLDELQRAWSINEINGIINKSVLLEIASKYN